MKNLRFQTGGLLLSLAALLACGTASAQSAKPSTCDPRQDPAACARESGAARQEAARGGLTQPGASADVNATARCQALPAAERTDCEARIQGSGAASTSTTSGSVMGGGLVRETVTPIPATPSR
ncbi:hypothetical protein QTI66_06625 [Variovorax sp. J22R133]|uniref:hypothetical protein n=1 Tax=Variovorax brevis TaxID=3053503 RepID=UPI0025789D26|nr:hypothetical protein [Variovorax sp. J22R133]MDM0111818.1 hypothetical protein [Variovorax sp. J22R133]